MPGPVRDRTIAQPSRASANRDADRPAPVEHAFAECGRKLGGGLHAAYLNTHAKGKSASPVSKVKLELYALLQDDRVIQRVEETAAKLLRDADKKHRAAIKGLPDVFENRDSWSEAKAAYERQIEDLYAEIGRLTTQASFLKKSCPPNWSFADLRAISERGMIGATTAGRKGGGHASSGRHSPSGGRVAGAVR